MSRSIVFPWSPARIESILKEGILGDDTARLATFKRNFMVALFCPQGMVHSNQDYVKIEWWLGLFKTGFPASCGFRCIDWDTGYGFGCFHPRPSVRPAAPAEADTYDDLDYEFIYGDCDCRVCMANVIADDFEVEAPLVTLLGYDVDSEPDEVNPLPPHKLEHPRFGKSAKSRIEEHDFIERWYGIYEAFRFGQAHVPVEERKHTHGRHARYGWWLDIRSTNWDTCRDRKQRQNVRSMRRKASQDRKALELWELGVRGDFLDKFLEEITDEDYSDPYYWDTDDDPCYWGTPDVYWGYELVDEMDFYVPSIYDWEYWFSETSEYDRYDQYHSGSGCVHFYEDGPDPWDRHYEVYDDSYLDDIVDDAELVDAD